MSIKSATNCNRTYATRLGSLASNFNADVIDFVDMPMGSIQVIWNGGTGVLDGEVRLYASNLPEVPSFDVDGTLIDGGVITIDAASGSRIWIRDRLAFRYLLARYSANGITGGTVDIIALGKKS